MVGPWLGRLSPANGNEVSELQVYAAHTYLDGLCVLFDEPSCEPVNETIFSKITKAGNLSELKPPVLGSAINQVVDYLRKNILRSVCVAWKPSTGQFIAPLSASLQSDGSLQNYTLSLIHI